MDPLIDLAPQDAAHLEWARRIARQGWGQVHPNPMVGCVLVKDGRVIGEGCHEAFGGPHAEIVALEQALGAAEGATAYVSLEPCNHHGKTPPCSDALRDAGVARVVYGAADPGAESGGGGAAMRASGVEVVGPVWGAGRARAENPAFFHGARHDTPFVALKLAISFDGRIAARPGAATRITGSEAQQEVHRLRTGFDAVMVGSGTVLADDPRLTPRLVGPGREPTRRVVLASEADIPADAALFEDLPACPVHVFCRTDAPEGALERLEAAGARAHPVDGGEAGLDLGAVLVGCRGLGIRSILCEGGAGLAGSLLRDRLVNRLYLFVAPTTLGASGLAAFGDGAERLDWTDFQPAEAPAAFGRDALLVYDRQDA